MIYGREKEVEFYKWAIKALEKVTDSPKWKKKAMVNVPYIKSYWKAFANVRKLGSQIGRT